MLDEVAAQVEQIVAEAAELRHGEPRTLDLSVELAGGRRLTGTVSQVYATTLVPTTFSQLNHKRRFRAWLPLLLAVGGEAAGTVRLRRDRPQEPG